MKTYFRGTSVIASVAASALILKSGIVLAVTEGLSGGAYSYEYGLPSFAIGGCYIETYTPWDWLIGDTLQVDYCELDGPDGYTEDYSAPVTVDYDLLNQTASGRAEVWIGNSAEASCASYIMGGVAHLSGGGGSGHAAVMEGDWFQTLVFDPHMYCGSGSGGSA